MSGVTNKTIIRRCAGLVSNGFVKPVLVGERIRSYRLTDFSINNEEEIRKR